MAKVIHLEILGSRTNYGGSSALLGTMLDISRSQARRAFTEDRLRFEKLLADLSTTFVNVPAERLDESIETSLKMLVAVLG